MQIIGEATMLFRAELRCQGDLVAGEGTVIYELSSEVLNLQYSLLFNYPSHHLWTSCWTATKTHKKLRLIFPIWIRIPQPQEILSRFDGEMVTFYNAIAMKLMYRYIATVSAAVLKNRDGLTTLPSLCGLRRGIDPRIQLEIPVWETPLVQAPCRFTTRGGMGRMGDCLAVLCGGSVGTGELIVFEHSVAFWGDKLYGPRCRYSAQVLLISCEF